MFEMLDYRAHKLFLILFGIPIILLTLFSLFVLPFIYYGIGLHFGESRISQIGIAIISIFFVDSILIILNNGLSKFSMFIFHLFVDVTPTDGRTKEEANQVVWYGDKAINLINFNNKQPEYLTDEDIEKISSGFFNFFFRKKIISRIDSSRNYFIENPNIACNEWNINEFLKREKLEIGIFEKIITNQFLRSCVIRYSIFLYLLIFNPYS